jgi:intracellular sulfur oxidation DsrE/DsrF family protein
MNAAVKMTVAGADAADALKALEGRGVQVMACGTCLKHYGLMESERSGRVSNAYEIMNALLESNVSPLI